MSEEKKCIKSEEITKEKIELTQEDLEQVAGGAGWYQMRPGAAPIIMINNQE